MAMTLEQFAAQCKRELTADPGPHGRQKVCALVQDALKDREFVDTYIQPDGPERKVLYRGSRAWLHDPRAQLPRCEKLEAARPRAILGHLRPSLG